MYFYFSPLTISVDSIIYDGPQGTEILFWSEYIKRQWPPHYHGLFTHDFIVIFTFVGILKHCLTFLPLLFSEPAVFAPRHITSTWAQEVGRKGSSVQGLK